MKKTKKESVRGQGVRASELHARRNLERETLNQKNPNPSDLPRMTAQEEDGKAASRRFESPTVMQINFESLRL